MHDKEFEEQPTVLYKYCAPQRVDILRNRLVRFTQRDDLNDIYEMRPTFMYDVDAHEAAREKLAQTHPDVPDIPVTTSEEDQSAIDYALQQALVLSLSSMWDLIPMWSYYADGHTGFVIGFDIKDPFLAESTTEPVQYTKTFPVMGNDFRPAIFHKFEQWRHEREWRSLRVLECDIPDRTECGRLHLFRFSPQAVIEVILGHRMKAEYKYELREILKDPAYDHVKLFEASPDKNAWAIQRKQT